MQCTVCFEDFGFLAGNTPMALPCQHTFCKQCVESLKLQNQMKTCPLCRTRFAPVQTVVNLGLRSALEEFKRICPPFLRSALEEFKRTCPRSRSRTPPQITARGSIGRVIHQPRTPPELIPAPVTPVPAPESPAVISPELADWMNSYESQHRVLWWSWYRTWEIPKR